MAANSNPDRLIHSSDQHGTLGPNERPTSDEAPPGPRLADPTTEETKVLEVDSPAGRAVLGELRRVFQTQHEAHDLLVKAGFPSHRIDWASSNPLEFWQRTANECGNGIIPGGLQPLIDAAAERYPANEIFKNYRSREQPHHPIIGPTQQREKSIELELSAFRFTIKLLMLLAVAFYLTFVTNWLAQPKPSAATGTTITSTTSEIGAQDTTFGTRTNESEPDLTISAEGLDDGQALPDSMPSQTSDTTKPRKKARRPKDAEKPEGRPTTPELLRASQGVCMIEGEVHHGSITYEECETTASERPFKWTREQTSGR